MADKNINPNELPETLLRSLTDRERAAESTRKTGQAGAAAAQIKSQFHEAVAEAVVAEAKSTNELATDTDGNEEVTEPHVSKLVFAAKPLPSQGTPAWLLTFGDLTALMLTFFVMLFAMSKISEESWTDVVSVLNRSFSTSQSKIPERAAELGIDSFGIGYGQNTEYLRITLGQLFQNNEQLKDAKVYLLEENLYISFENHMIFRKGTAQLVDEKADFKILNELALIFNQLENQIEIIGNAGDPAPLAEGQNAMIQQIALSLDRSRFIAVKLIENGYKGRPGIIALGNSTLNELSKELSPELKDKLIRRVDIVIKQDAKGQ